MFLKLCCAFGTAFLFYSIHFYFVLRCCVSYSVLFVLSNVYYSFNLRRGVVRENRTVNYILPPERQIDILLYDQWYMTSGLLVLVHIALTIFITSVSNYQNAEDRQFLLYLLLLDSVVIKCFKVNCRSKEMELNTRFLHHCMHKHNERYEKIQKIKSKLKKAAPSVSDQCSICYDVFQDPIELPCTHVFCESCILKWFFVNKQQRCPYCRQNCVYM